MLAIVQT